MSPDQHIKLYINNENGAIVFLIISHSYYLMEFQNQGKQKNMDEFQTLTICKVNQRGSSTCDDYRKNIRRNPAKKLLW